MQEAQQRVAALEGDLLLCTMEEQDQQVSEVQQEEDCYKHPIPRLERQLLGALQEHTLLEQDSESNSVRAGLEEQLCEVEAQYLLAKQRQNVLQNLVNSTRSPVGQEAPLQEDICGLREACYKLAYALKEPSAALPCSAMWWRPCHAMPCSRSEERR